MKKISRVMGIFLTVALLASLLVFAAPASAATPLQWNQEADPNTSNQLASGISITDLAVSADGQTIYAATGTTTLYKSTNGGTSFSPKGSSYTTIAASLVAVAPDDEDVAAIATTTAVYITTNGFSSAAADITPSSLTGSITSIDISKNAGSGNVLAIGTDAGYLYIRTLSTTGSWDEVANGYATGSVIRAVAFSTNYDADSVLTAVTNDGSNTYLEIYSSNSDAWNTTASFTGYPVTIISGTAATSAAIALSPTYLGSDDIERVAFVGTNSGLYRLEDVNVTTLKSSINVNSVAFDGSTLIAGLTGSNTVWRSTNPLDTTPNFSATATKKGPGYATNTVLVAFSGSNVVAGTSGSSSAFAVSTDSGKSFNDVSLVDATFGTMHDLAVSEDGTVAYMVTEDASNYFSVWRLADSAWSRVLSIYDATSTSYIVRIAADDADVVYVAPLASTEYIYYSKDGGTEKWYARTGKSMVDLAVESTTVAYYAAAGGSVYKTANGGFTWGSAVSTGLSDIYSLTCIGEGYVLAGGDTTSKVAYTTDGNDSWSRTGTITGSAGNIVTIASGLADGDYIYAGGDTDILYRWTIGDSTSTGTWTALTDGTSAYGTAITGIALSSGTLYAASANSTPNSGVLRNTAPTSTAGCDEIAAAGYNFGATPAALRVSLSDSYTKLWALDTTGIALYSYIDSLSITSPAPTGPAEGYVVSTNPLNGQVYSMTFTWPGVTNATKYYIGVYTDAACTEVFATDSFSSTSSTVSYVLASGTLNPGITYYWRVKVLEPISSAWSTVYSFTAEAAGVLAPEIESPANGGTTTDTTPAFTWSPISGATSYTFQLSEAADFATTLVDAATTTTAYQGTTELTVGGTYFWRVQVAAPNAGEWSSIGTFTVVEPAATTEATTTVNVPEITVPAITVPTPSVTVTVDDSGGTTVSPALLWTVIIIGAVLVIALIVLILRTRRNV